MKRYAKLFSLIIVFVLVLTAIPAAFAAGVKPGQTATASFTFKGIYGVDGTFTYSNASILKNVSYSTNGKMAGKVNKDVAYFYSSESSDFTIKVNAKVADTAKNGDTCKITFTYRTSDANGDMTGWKKMTKTIKVEIHDCEDKNKDHKCDSCGKVLTSCKDSNQDLKCDICGAKVTPPVNYKELDRQLEIAGGLKEKEYTQDSWKALENVWNKAKNIRKKGNQEAVDAAAKDLEKAISELVKIDYSKLLEAVEKAKNIGDEKYATLIERLIEALDAADAALADNDQAAVDAAATELEAVIEELDKLLKDGGQADATDVPAEPSCNISWHKLLLILLIISVLCNVVLVVIVVGKKKKEK